MIDSPLYNVRCIKCTAHEKATKNILDDRRTTRVYISSV